MKKKLRLFSISFPSVFKTILLECEETHEERVWKTNLKKELEKSLEEKVTLQQVGELFNQLPEKQKAVIEAIYIEGKSQQEVADELEIPLGTVKSRTRLALQRLKDMLETHD